MNYKSSGVLIVLDADPLEPWLESHFGVALQNSNAQAQNVVIKIEDLMPHVHSTEQILTHDWRYTVAEPLCIEPVQGAFNKQHAITQMSRLEYIIFQAVSPNSGSAAVMKSVLLRSCGNGDTLPLLPGYTWSVGQWQFDALLALKEFRPLVFMLAQQRDLFDNKIITSVTMIKGTGSDDKHPSFIWHLGEATEAPIKRAAVFHYGFSQRSINGRMLNANYMETNHYMQMVVADMKTANIEASAVAELLRHYGITSAEYDKGKIDAFPGRQGPYTPPSAPSPPQGSKGKEPQRPGSGESQQGDSPGSQGSQGAAGSDVGRESREQSVQILGDAARHFMPVDDAWNEEWAWAIDDPDMGETLAQMASDQILEDSGILPPGFTAGWVKDTMLYALTQAQVQAQQCSPGSPGEGPSHQE